MNGAAGGPRIVITPGGVGMLSPILTSAFPLTLTPVLANGPITSGYGKPQTELIIMQIEPAVASGNPLARMNGGRTAMIVPVSGGPDAPGLIMTIAPMLTGGPGKFSSPYAGFESEQFVNHRSTEVAKSLLRW